MKLFSTREVKEIDQMTIKDQKIKSIDLMERAAIACSEEIMARWDSRTTIVIFAGPGNNGGDSLAIARILHNSGYRIAVYLFNPKNQLSHDCRINKERLSEFDDIEFYEITQGFEPPLLTEDVLVVDGIFGSGLNAPCEGGFASVIQYINSGDSPVVSIDIPSGLFGEDNSNNIPRNIIRANLTLTFEFPKLSMLFAENEKFTGEVVIMEINLSQTAKSEILSNYYLTERSDIKKLIRKRNKFAHKGVFGKAFLVAGSYGMMGAAVLAAKACARTGAGITVVHGPDAGCNVIHTSLPEAIYKTDKNPKIITLIGDTKEYNAVAIGPGIGTDPNTAWALRMLLKELKRPAVIDADALNIIASSSGMIETIPANTIITPHPKEFERLFGKTTNSYDRLKKAKEMAIKHSLIIVLKGAYTAVCLPSGNIHFNSTGNPGMATAGSGDVLTGIILSLLAQNYLPEQAAILGVFLHGFAGDIALPQSSEQSMLASDIINHISTAYRQLKI